MSISVQASGRAPIVATVAGGKVSANVSASSTTVAASVLGGVGPTGPVGPAGSTTLAGAADVELTSPASGDLLRYEDSKWKNYPERSLVLDGGNW